MRDELLEYFNIHNNVTKEELKKRYKEMVQKLHPVLSNDRRFFNKTP